LKSIIGLALLAIAATAGFLAILHVL
jgi:hypothetical protein